MTRLGGRVLVLTLVALGWSGALASSPPKVVRIGDLGSKVGVLEGYGKYQTMAITLAVEEINAKGGVLGHKIEILSEDDDTKPATAVRKADTLILRDGVKLLIGAVSSDATMAVMDVTKKHRTIHWNSVACAEFMRTTKFHKYYFSNEPDSRMQANALARYTLDKLGQTATIIFDRIERNGPVSTLIINRPQVKNALDNEAARALGAALMAIATLLAFIALIALLNWPLTWLGEVTGIAAAIGKPTNLATIFGYILAPLAWVIGAPWQDAQVVGSLIGQKVVINEFVAYLQLGDIVNGKVAGVSLTDQGRLIATYALCGFANFSSIAIQIGGIGGLAPERRHDLARFGMRAVLGGSIATFMTATIAGVLTWLGS